MHRYYYMPQHVYNNTRAPMVLKLLNYDIPVSPSSPEIITYTLESVPAPFLSDVVTNTSHVSLPPTDKNANK